MTTCTYSTDSPANVRTGLLVLPMFHGPKGPLPGPGVKEVGLEQAYRDAKLTGKKQENLLVVRRDGDRFTAGAVLLVGAGDKAELDVERRQARAGSGGERVPALRDRRDHVPAGGHREGRRRRDAGGGRGHRARQLPLRSLQDREVRDQAAHPDHGARLGAGRCEGGARGRQARAGRRRGRLLGARPGEHAGRRHAARADRARGAEDGARGRPPLQGLGEARAGEGRVRRHPRRRRRQREPPAPDRALVQGRRHRDTRSRSPARASRSTPAACRSRTPRAWRR